MNKREAEKMPDSVWLGSEWEHEDGMPTTRLEGHYIEYEGWPEGTEYVRADILASALARIASLEAALDAWYRLAREASNSPVMRHAVPESWWNGYERALLLHKALSTPTQEEGT